MVTGRKKLNRKSSRGGTSLVVPPETESLGVAEATIPYGLESGAAVFSPASFFDVLQEAPQHKLVTPEPLEPLSLPVTVAFYGFRGGAGRTLALAHVAVLLAKRGLKVVALDLDLEAPGLHTALGVKLPEGVRGSVTLLRDAVVRKAEESLGVEHSLLPVDLPGLPGKLLVLPAGKINELYLAQLEELGVNLWHLHQPSPLLRLLGELRSSVAPDVILLDCRTGFSALSATALFHLADMAFVFLPLSEQVWDGVDVLLAAARASKARRQGRPALVFVPSMVPADESGRRLTQRFVERLEKVYEHRLGKFDGTEEAGLDDEPLEPWVREGISYDPRIAAGGRVSLALGEAGVWGLYQPLLQALHERVDVGVHPPADLKLDRNIVLKELQIPSAFADESPDDAPSLFLKPWDFDRSVDPSTALILGAKGSGKTQLWRYLLESPDAPRVHGLPASVRFIRGHGPKGQHAGPLDLSADGFKQLERAARMKGRGTYKTFWIAYALERLQRENRPLAEVLLERAAAEVRGSLDKLFRAASALDRVNLLAELLQVEGIELMLEDLLGAADDALLKLAPDRSCLVYDGLDTGFETGLDPADWLDRRSAFVRGLLQVLLEWRARLRRIAFKVFLRDDIFLAIEMQNRSHLSSFLHELTWRPEDLWRLALKIATTCSHYRRYLEALQPGVSEPWPLDEESLEKLLFPLWGQRLGGGNKSFSAKYVRRRIADAKQRLFPRTLVQLLASAVEEERKLARSFQPDQILGGTSLSRGIARASDRRVQDLKTEYTELRPYLEALQGSRPLATREQFAGHLRTRGARSGGLHLGKGGWLKVVDQLAEVGVLGPPARRKSEEDDRLEVALLYREGLGIKSGGLK